MDINYTYVTYGLIILAILVIIYFLYKYMKPKRQVSFSPNNKIIPAKYNLILFYSDNCGHCQDFKPIWNNFKKQYLNKINIEEINIQDSEFAKLNIDIEGVPMVMLETDKGKFFMKSYPRTVEGIKQFIEANTK
jgi:thiol-disulfide isomerase/thioredoxin